MTVWIEMFRTISKIFKTIGIYFALMTLFFAHLWGYCKKHHGYDWEMMPFFTGLISLVIMSVATPVCFMEGYP